uniref:Proliferating cell nuclear antigen PCNA C-terminal domain-containing protein n=1 Tax=viral metagenome TaxID=1070528 RepID=A0A6C0E3B1_9ZZZZ
MKLQIQEKSKIDVFVAIFQLLKNCSSVIKLDFFQDKMYIQGMDKSHVCLFNVHICNHWFQSYLYESNECQSIVVDSSSFFTILSRSQENNTIVIYCDDGPADTLNIDMLVIDPSGKSEYNRYFQVPLVDTEQETLEVPDIEYDAEFSLKSKQLFDLAGQLILFGDVINIICSEDGIDLNTSGDHGKMKVSIPIDDLNEFSISEGETIDLSYSLTYLHKMCLTTKLSKDISIGIREDYPISIKYDLGETSYVLFFVAPKMK